MERLLYTAVSGAELNNTALRVTANNLANISTPGFKADLEQAQAMMVSGDGYRTRYQAQMLPVTTDLSEGAIMETGRDLDIAIGRGGYLAVTDAQGEEAYTRAGSLQVDSEGFVTVNGYRVRDDGAEIQLPEFGDIDVGADGTLNIVPVGGGLIAQEARLKLVSSEGQLLKGLDGLLRDANEQELARDETITVRSGALEGSNVNAVEQMVKTMNISRQFEINVKMMKTADELAVAGNKLVGGQG